MNLISAMAGLIAAAVLHTNVETPLILIAQRRHYHCVNLNDYSGANHQCYDDHAMLRASAMPLSGSISRIGAEPGILA